MPIVVSTALVISDDLAEINANSPVIGYRNAVTMANIATTTQNADYPRTNLANPATHLLWKGTSTVADEYVTVTLDGATTADYVGIARHNFGTAGIECAVETYDGATWTEVAALLPADDSPILFRFDGDMYDGVRLRLSPGSAVPQMAVLYVGELLSLQRRIYVGHTPINYGIRNTVVVGRAEAGHYLGRVITGQHTETSVDLKNLTPSWYRTYLQPFVVAAQEAPFFFAWRPSSYPLEVGYAWLTSDPIPKNQLPNGMMQVQLDMSGIV